jgi:hypothetical protein
MGIGKAREGGMDAGNIGSRRESTSAALQILDTTLVIILATSIREGSIMRSSRRRIMAAATTLIMAISIGIFGISSPAQAGCGQSVFTLKMYGGSVQGWYCSGVYYPKDAYVDHVTTNGWSGAVWQYHPGTEYRSTYYFCDWQEWSYSYGWKITAVQLYATKPAWC